MGILLFLSHLPAAGKYPLAVPEMLTRVDSPETPHKVPKAPFPDLGVGWKVSHEHRAPHPEPQPLRGPGPAGRNRLSGFLRGAGGGVTWGR